MLSTILSSISLFICLLVLFCHQFGLPVLDLLDLFVLPLVDLPIDDQATGQHEEKDQGRGRPFELVVDGPMRIRVERFGHDQGHVGRVLEPSGRDQHQGHAADDLKAADDPSVILGRNLEIQRLAQRKFLGVFRVFVA